MKLINIQMYQECQGNESECACQFQTDFYDENDMPIIGCPWKRIEHLKLCEAFIGWYQAFKNGFLLYGGAWGEQPAWYCDGITIINSEQNRIDAMEHSRSREAFKQKYDI